MVLAYRGMSVIVLAPVLAMLAVVLSGEGNRLLGIYTQVFMYGVLGFVVKYFPVFLLGAIFGKLMEDSGAARRIALSIIGSLGSSRVILAIVLACAILTYGGVSVFVVVFAVYPIAASIFREANIPKRLIPATVALGSATFTMTCLPGTVQIQNIIPTVYFGTDIYALSDRELVEFRLHNIGFIFQQYNLIPSIDVAANAAVPLIAQGMPINQARARAKVLLEKLNIADQADKLPSMVSGGQQQRAAIARALANDPPLLVADEPTGNLDSRTAGDVFDLFNKLVDEGKSMLMVTHDKELARRVPRVVEITNGKITRDEYIGGTTAWAGY